MAIILNEITGAKRFWGTETDTVPAGKTIKIETSPQGVEILKVTVPAGKTWTVSFGITIDED